MARFFIFAAVLATFSANAGASWFSRTAAVKADNDVRERRATEDKQVLYCNSMGCPSGYTPIDNAKDVECEDDPCEVSQCCEAFCSYHPCPNNCTPVTDAATILCDDSGCTTDLCCDCVDEIPPLYCNSIACPDSCYVPIDNAKEVECDNDPCEVTQCCQSFCSSHACPNNCTRVDDASLIVCDACECTTDLCCNCATDDSNDDGVDTQYCDSVTCSFENDLIENAEQVACDYDPCQEMQCCEAVCAYIPCPSFCTGGEPTTLCEPSGCTLDLCCNCDDEPVETLYCDSIGCPDGYTPIKNAKYVPCEHEWCDVAQCCESYCSHHACPNDCTPIEDAAAILCDNSGCTTDVCCDCCGP